ncbi:MAG: glycosyltransferase family 2 protein [Verrucomicrobia bacterium]|nr:glycosyltransferase family 2 protein [Verrucomicrobiota bacterium]
MSDSDKCPVTAIVPACRRPEKLLETLRRIQACRPAPAEILVGVDGGAPVIVDAVRAFDPGIRILTSNKLLGPGGSRNELLAAAASELVANFDDDSFPAHPDYFGRVMGLAEHFPTAAMFSAASHAQEWQSLDFQRIAVPSGCGCVFRRSWFQRTRGFVPLPIAYNMEEVDIGLQLHALGGMIVHDPLLRVLHDNVPKKEVDANINAHVLANTALFSYLCFPAWLWPVGALSVLNRLVLLFRWGWTAGILEGLRMLPDYLQKHKQDRREINGSSVFSWLLLKRRPENLGDARTLSGGAPSLLK